FNDKSLIKTLYALLKTVRKFNVNPSVYQDFVRLKREKYNTNGIILTNSFLNSNNSNTAWTSYFKAVLAFEDKLTTADSALTDGRVRNIFDLNEALLTEAEKKKLIAQLKNHADSKYDDLHPKKSAPQKQFISPRHLTPLHSVTSNSNSNSDSDSDDDDQNATVRIIQSKNPLSDTEIVSDIIASIHRAFPNFNSVNNLETLIEQINEKINKNQMTPFELLNQLIQNDGVYAALLFIKHFKDFTFPEVTALLQTLKEHDPTTTNIKILIKLQNICSEKKQVIITPLIYLIQQNEISKATQLVEGFLADSKYDNAVLGITGLDSYGNRLDPLTLLLDKKSKETNDNKIDHLINLLTPLSKEFNLEQSASSSKSDEFQDL
ncbi:MAG: hypothetical protein VW397_07910, partial [Candidatus Margulisiibacteriota bacterium]